MKPLHSAQHPIKVSDGRSPAFCLQLSMPDIALPPCERHCLSKGSIVISIQLDGTKEERYLCKCMPQHDSRIGTSSTLQPLDDVVTATLSPNSVANGMLNFSRLDAPLVADSLLACVAAKQRDRCEWGCCCRHLSAGWPIEKFVHMPPRHRDVSHAECFCTALTRPTLLCMASTAEFGKL